MHFYVGSHLFPNQRSLTTGHMPGTVLILVRRNICSQVLSTMTEVNSKGVTRQNPRKAAFHNLSKK